MKVFLILAMSLCVVHCGSHGGMDGGDNGGKHGDDYGHMYGHDILVEIIREFSIGHCEFGCNRCPPMGGGGGGGMGGGNHTSGNNTIDDNNGGNNGTNNNTLIEAQQTLATARVEKQAAEDNLTEAKTAQTSVNSASTATEELLNATGNGNSRRYRRATDTVSLTLCDTPPTQFSGSVTNGIIRVLNGLVSALEDLSTDNLNTTVLDCYIKLAEDLTKKLNTGALNKPSVVSGIRAAAANVTTAVETKNSTIATIVNDRQRIVREKTQAVEEAKDAVVQAGGTVTGG